MLFFVKFLSRYSRVSFPPLPRHQLFFTPSPTFPGKRNPILVVRPLLRHLRKIYISNKNPPFFFISSYPIKPHHFSQLRHTFSTSESLSPAPRSCLFMVIFDNRYTLSKWSHYEHFHSIRHFFPSPTRIGTRKKYSYFRVKGVSLSVEHQRVRFEMACFFAKCGLRKKLFEANVNFLLC